ncbi:hypothetical protein [Acidovorax sp. FG27]|uniref:hypothetical protein n=1 Tax=Acidovorax sp. FG27 TaxID=3133652 RepID=UPI0030EAA600
MSARAALWWLALCLVLGPALGRMHQVVHGPLASPAAAAAKASAHGALGHQADAHHRASGGGHAGVHALFQGHGGADCELLDQLLFGGALLPAPLVVAALAAAPLTAEAASRGIDARLQRGFLARAPPAAASA